VSLGEPELSETPGRRALNVDPAVAGVSWVWKYDWPEYCEVPDERGGLPSVGAGEIIAWAVASLAPPVVCHGANADNGCFAAHNV